jgi:hypothetical protein
MKRRRLLRGSPQFFALLLIACAFSSLAHARAAELEQRLLYVVEPGIRDYVKYGGAGILVFDIDRGHRFVKRIETPASRVEKPENIKGVCASAATGRLYFTTLTRLYCLDLKNNEPLWDKALPGGCDRMALTPDGRRLYVPSLEGPHWNVVDAVDGNLITKIETKSGSHNTVCSPDGSRVFCAGLKSPLLSVVDPKTNEIVEKVGPFGAAIRPLTVNADASRVYVNVNGLLGFEIGDTATGKMIERVEIKDYKQGPTMRHGCPCHGIGLSPDGRELWLCDSFNKRLHVFDVSASPAKQVGGIALRDEPGWVTLSIDGRFAYPSTGEVIDTAARKIVATLEDEKGRAVESEKLLEIDFRGDAVSRAGNQFAVGAIEAK